MLKTITAYYLVLPSFLFVAGWLRWPYALASLICLFIYSGVLAVDAYHHLREWRLTARSPARWDGWQWGGLLAASALVFAWLMLSGTGGFGYQNFDYQANNALLKDLILNNWPLIAQFEGQPVHMVYYVAYYLPAAVVGKWLGWSAANLFLFAWTYTGLILAFAWFARIGRIKLEKRPSRYLGLVVFFCLAGGLDLIATQLLTRADVRMSDHVEPWAAFFQFSSNTTLIYWVPQHTLAIWLLTGLFCDVIYRRQSLKYIGMPAAAAFIWSPFGVVGLVPLLIMTLVVYLRRPNQTCLFNRDSLVLNGLAAWVGAVYLLYLGSNQFHFPTGWIWKMVEGAPGFLFQRLWQFWVFEFGLAAFITVMILVLGAVVGHSANSSAESTRIHWGRWLAEDFDLSREQVLVFVACLIVLLMLPLYKMGVHNDLVMRGSVSALFFFWAFLAKVLFDASSRVKRRLRPLFLLLIMILLIGFYPSLAEISRSLENYHFGPPLFSSVSTSGEVNSYEIVVQKIANEDSIFYQYLSK